MQLEKKMVFRHLKCETGFVRDVLSEKCLLIVGLKKKTSKQKEPRVYGLTNKDLKGNSIRVRKHGEPFVSHGYVYLSSMNFQLDCFCFPHYFLLRILF